MEFYNFPMDRQSCPVTISSCVYSAVRANIEFRRRIQNFLLCFYIPTILTVMLSRVFFFISPNSAPARCALGITTVLAVGGFLTGQQRSSPVVSYVTSADMYILVCYVFVFCALLEYAVVHYFFVYEKQIYRYQLQQQSLIDQSVQGITQDLLIDKGALEENISLYPFHNAAEVITIPKQKAPSKLKCGSRSLGLEHVARTTPC
ncbi:gamma-aminobutyric acid receptor subunit gamma-1 isoform X2 [Nematostella vectensis]|nr:gamma-aminobutyric acid receptor subunit gamma-1 isoform X2 [Nematostella vectensis]